MYAVFFPAPRGWDRAPEAGEVGGHGAAEEGVGGDDMISGRQNFRGREKVRLLYRRTQAMTTRKN